jgi:hypothetical protein
MKIILCSTKMFCSVSNSVSIMKSSVFFDTSPYSPVKANRRFGGPHRFHLQSQKVSHARNRHEAGRKQTYASFIWDLWTVRDYIGLMWSKTKLKNFIFWDTMPCMPLEVKADLYTCFIQVSCMACSLTLKMEEICFSDMSVDFKRTTRRYFPEERTIHDHRCENLKSYLKLNTPDLCCCRSYN